MNVKVCLIALLGLLSTSIVYSIAIGTLTTTAPSGHTSNSKPTATNHPTPYNDGNQLEGDPKDGGGWPCINGTKD